MARTTPSTQIESLVREFTARIEAVVRQAVAEQVGAYVAELRDAKPVAAGTTRMCPFPGCGSPAAGPRNRWRCRAHKDAAIPDGASTVSVRRLPPGPRPGEKRRAGPPMECRAAGCVVRSRGPRFNFFCAEHYRDLSPEKQAEAIKAWRLRRAQAPTPATPPAPFEGSVIRRKPKAPADASTTSATEGTASPAPAPQPLA